MCTRGYIGAVLSTCHPSTCFSTCWMSRKSTSFWHFSLWRVYFIIIFAYKCEWSYLEGDIAYNIEVHVSSISEVIAEASLTKEKIKWGVQYRHYWLWFSTYIIQCSSRAARSIFWVVQPCPPEKSLYHASDQYCTYWRHNSFALRGVEPLLPNFKSGYITSRNETSEVYATDSFPWSGFVRWEHTATLSNNSFRGFIAL